MTPIAPIYCWRRCGNTRNSSTRWLVQLGSVSPKPDLRQWQWCRIGTCSRLNRSVLPPTSALRYQHQCQRSPTPTDNFCITDNIFASTVRWRSAVFEQLRSHAIRSAVTVPPPRSGLQAARSEFRDVPCYSLYFTLRCLRDCSSVLSGMDRSLLQAPDVYTLEHMGSSSGWPGLICINSLQSATSPPTPSHYLLRRTPPIPILAKSELG